MVPLHQPNSSLGKWLLKYRLIIAIVSIFILVPAAFVIALYVGDYLKYQKVTFDQVVVKDFQSTYITTDEALNHQEINLENSDVLVKIKLDSYNVPAYYDETGDYTFRAKYVEKANKAVSNLQITMILQTEWMDAKSAPYQTSIAKNYNAQYKITFNQILPHSPLWFVNVERPVLYVKVSYQIELGLGQTEIRESYYKANLVGLIATSEVTN